MTSVSGFSGHNACNDTYNGASGNGAMGRAHTSVDRAAEEIVRHHDRLSLTGDAYSTRWGKFANTVKTFARGAGDVGALTGTAAMLPVDFIVGRGGSSEKGDPMLINEGLVGNSVKFTGAILSDGFEMVGKGAGAAVGAGTVAAKDVDQKPGDWIAEGSNRGGEMTGKTSGHLLGTALGVSMAAARVPSLAVKWALRGSFAIAGGVIGVFAGATRAVVNK